MLFDLSQKKTELKEPLSAGIDLRLQTFLSELVIKSSSSTHMFGSKLIVSDRWELVTMFGFEPILIISLDPVMHKRRMCINLKAFKLCNGNPLSAKLSDPKA